MKNILFNLKWTLYYLRKDFPLFLLFNLIGLVLGAFFTVIGLATHHAQGSILGYFICGLLLGIFFLNKSGKVATLGIPVGFTLWGIMLPLLGVN